MSKMTLSLVLALLLPAVLWAGGTTEPGKEATGAQPAAAAASGKYKEAPMLAEMVKAGKLPPVEKRLPDNPLVIGQNMLVKGEDLKVEVGKYGGPAFKSITTNAAAGLEPARRGHGELAEQPRAHDRPGLRQRGREASRSTTTTLSSR